MAGWYTQIPTIEDFRWRFLYIKMKDPNDYDTIDALYYALKEAVEEKSEHVDAFYKSGKKTDEIAQMLNLVFSIVIAIMMFLCFFSLSASMSANLYDQTKEIGILRSIGFSKTRIRLLYFYEALILVFTSSLLGVFIGFVVGWTMTLQ